MPVSLTDTSTMASARKAASMVILRASKAVIDHRVHAVHRQTYYHLLQVNAIGPNEQWLPGVIRVQGNVSIPRLGEKDIHRVCNDVIEIELLSLDLAPALQEFFQMLNDVRRPAGPLA